jgi:integrase
MVASSTEWVETPKNVLLTLSLTVAYPGDSKPLRHSPLRMEPAVGIEPTTDGLQNRCSTTELSWLISTTYNAVENAHLTFSDSFPTLRDMKHRATKTKPETVKVGNITVPIYKRERRIATGNYIIYEIADHTTGVRRLRSFSDHAEARQEAEKLARQIATGETTAATMRNSEAASYGRALELLRPTGATLELAAMTYAKCYEILGGDLMIEAAKFYRRHRADKITKKKVADVVVELLAAKEARKKSNRYVADLRTRLTRFAGAFGADVSTIKEPDKKDATGEDRRNRGVDISSITAPEVQSWLDKLKVEPQTAKNYRTVLYTLFGFAETRGYILRGGNPVEETESIETKDGGAIEIYTTDEIAGLLKAAKNVREDFLPVIAIGAFAGLRAAEIERLEWSNVDLTGGYIHVGADKAKTRSRRLAPITPNLAQWLTPYAKEKGKVWTGTPQTIRDARAQTATAAKVAWKDNALRHSFISYRLADIHDEAKVALEAGTSAKMIFKHYRELVKPSAGKAWFAVEPAAPQNVTTLQQPNAFKEQHTAVAAAN